jgi:hypothetical protein
MSLLKQGLALLLTIFQTLLYGWIIALVNLVKDLVALFRRWIAEKKLPRQQRRGAPTNCVKVSDPAFKRPDPLIYAQYYLMAQGFGVTWDNPDIELLEGGVTVPSHALKPNTDYEIVARCWNNSTEAPCYQMPVLFGYLSFGIGTVSHFIGQDVVDLGVKGGPQHPAFARVKWKTPALAGHYCIQTLLLWKDDKNPLNNFGQENVNVGVLASPAVVEFQLRNDTPQPQQYRFEVDSYVVPGRDPCGPRRHPDREGGKPKRGGRQLPGTVDFVPEKHRRANYPVPVGWTVDLIPPALDLMPGQEVTVKAAVTAPAGFKGVQAINVHAFHDKLAGGFTFYIEGK